MTDKIPLTRDEIKNYDINVTRPIYVKNIFDDVGQELHSSLENIILKTVDEWKRRLTVVQANITNLKPKFEQKKSNNFRNKKKIKNQSFCS